MEATRQGREELKLFEDAPILMDRRRRTDDGSESAELWNSKKLSEVSARSGVPIVCVDALHVYPEGVKNVESWDADEFQGMESELLLCEEHMYC